MMTDEQKSKVAELKAAIAASAPATGGAPQEVRAAALVLRDELRQEGTTARVLARALGIHETTLCRWQHVAVAARAPSVPAARSLRVAHAPSGLVIDGLDVETLAALLRRMS